ncbi:MAG TPA: hypothetical protein VMY35_12835 [Phycisphaerae bacterium]|nr:hypothetical protein [Phycisphaerae bacterium]
MSTTDTTDLAVQRAEAFAAMELARASGNFQTAQRAKERLESLGVRVRYMRTRWPKQGRRARREAMP